MGSEVISVVERRRRWPREKKIEVLMEALEPGASVTAVADRHGVARNLVYTWLRLAREGRLDGMSPLREAGFVAVDVAPASPPEAVPSPPRPSAALPPNSKYPTPAASRPRRSASIEVRLANGRTIKVDESIDPVVLAAIVAALDDDAHLRQDGGGP
jgi:transposase